MAAWHALQRLGFQGSNAVAGNMFGIPVVPAKFHSGGPRFNYIGNSHSMHPATVEVANDSCSSPENIRARGSRETATGPVFLRACGCRYVACYCRPPIVLFTTDHLLPERTRPAVAAAQPGRPPGFHSPHVCGERRSGGRFACRRPNAQSSEGRGKVSSSLTTRIVNGCP